MKERCTKGKIHFADWQREEEAHCRCTKSKRSTLQMHKENKKHIADAQRLKEAHCRCTERKRCTLQMHREKKEAQMHFAEAHKNSSGRVGQYQK